VWYSKSMSEDWVVEASMRPVGGSWSPPEEISARSGEIDSLEVEVYADGNVAKRPLRATLAGRAVKQRKVVLR
jgi:hypothetical protein